MRWRAGTRGLCLLLLGLVGCGREEPPARDLAASAVLGNRPSQLAAVRLVQRGAACPIERVNGEPVRALPALRAGTFATFGGWSTVADDRNPTPPLVHLVLRPAGSDGEADAFLPGKRVPRNDPSSTEARMRNAGFVVSGRLPEVPGKYQVLLWVGDSATQVACDTQQQIELL